MKSLATYFALYLLWMSCLPCTDQILDKHEHHPNVYDAAQSTGQSPFHENTCPIFCGCGCCAIFTIAVEPELIVFRKPIEQPETYPLFFIVPNEKHFTSSIWNPPRQVA
ncbi:hypothetical protein ACFSKU_11300 [Pontibacter silvestris]|uniref:Zinc-or iron-chelating domain-containing protein n=1 Tax=Pontibacter silvestris TaxID=2305183 RepID=A0ABW4WYY6_9BACT|nr:hypothetical protein [Pontibacter silvestris]MCC9135396.1 hypothetical protein [Pontibacter silvestris]